MVSAKKGHRTTMGISITIFFPVLYTFLLRSTHACRCSYFTCGLSLSLQHWRSAVRSVEGEGEGGAVDPLVAEEAFLLTQQICANVVAYCRVPMTVGGERMTSCGDITADAMSLFEEVVLVSVQV